MRFTIAKPADYMSFGDLFYTRPFHRENREPFRQLAKLCRQRADEEFPLDAAHPENRVIIRQIERELHMIENPDHAIMVLILKEIADLSHEMGYQTTLWGAESGLIIMYLLGISGIHPRQYQYSTIPSDLYLAVASYHCKLSFTLAIAEPVRGKIQRRLDQKFGNMRTLNHVYHKIGLPDCDGLEMIGDAAEKTGIDHHRIDLEDPDLLKSVCDDICHNDLKIERYFAYPETSLDLARVFAYAVCDSETKDRFDSVKDYVFRDDVFKALNETDLCPHEVEALARNWSLGDEKIKDNELMKQHGVPEEVIGVYRELGNQWPAASCLARVNSMLMVKFYEERLGARLDKPCSETIRMNVNTK